MRGPRNSGVNQDNRRMNRFPTYLRIVTTTKCNYACSYCHRDGVFQQSGTKSELPSDILKACLKIAATAGIKKFKLVGGEPFLREDLPDVIYWIRQASPEADISLITAGVVSPEKLHAAWDAGLSRLNISIHGFTKKAFFSRNRSEKAYQKRDKFIRIAISENRAPIKFNYVYSSQRDDADLSSMLDWAASNRLFVNVLDNLSLDLSWESIANVICRLHGDPEKSCEQMDPDSLPTLFWEYDDGLQIEIKNHKLGDLAPYNVCSDCDKKSSCKEGIFALRLTHDGKLQPCMDRPDLSLPLSEISTSYSGFDASARWKKYVASL
jgi:cyclic pyranopterin phosphate synthase